MSKSEHNTSDRSIDRRTFMKTVGASAGAAAVGTAGSSPASALLLNDSIDWAKDGLKAGIKYSPWGQAVNGTSWALGGLGDWLGGGNDSPTAGEISFHQTTTNAFQRWKRVSSVHIENQLENSQMVADIAARNAIADAWEDGQSESEASQAALDAIDDYHSIMWRNTFVSKQANALQVAYVIQTAANTTEADYSNWTNIGPTPANADYTGSGSIVDGGTQISPSTTQTDITLPNGETPTLEVIEFSVEWDNGDTWSSLLDNSFLDGYDSASGDFTFPTDQGNEFTDAFTASNLNVPDADLPSKRILNCADLADKLGRIEQNATDLKQAYDLNRVGDIYTALDNGNVTANQIRGVAGLAEHLSGTSDASEGRYQIALSTLFDVPRPDMSQVATVTIEHSGATDIEISVGADGTRRRELTGQVTDKVYQGQLFASSISSDLAAGATYLSDPVTYSIAGDSVIAFDLSGAELWRQSMTSLNPYGLAISPDHSEIYVGGFSGSLKSLSRSGAENWSANPAAEIRSVSVDASGGLFVGTGSSVMRLDPSDGSTMWSVSTTNSAAIRCESTDTHVVFATFGGNLGYVTKDGQKVFDKSVSGTAINDMVVSRDGTYALVASDATLEKYNLSEESTDWSISESTGDIMSVDIDNDADSIYYIDSNGTVVKCGLDGTQQSTNSHGSVGVVYPLPGTSDYLVGDSNGSIARYDSTHSQTWQNSISSSEFSTLSTVGERNQYDGLIRDPQFSAATEDGMSQLYLSGETKIIEMKDADGNSVDNVKSGDFGSPKYDSADISEWSDYMQKITDEWEAALDEIADNDPIFGGGGGGFNIPTLPGFGVIESIVIVGVGFLGLSAVNS